MKKLLLTIAILASVASANTAAYYDLGNSNMVIGGSSNIIKYMIDTLGSGETHMSGALSGMDSWWAKDQIKTTVFQSNTVTHAVIFGMGTNDVTHSLAAPETTLTRMCQRWRACVDTIYDSCVAHACSLIVLFPPPRLYDNTLPTCQTYANYLRATIWDYCVNKNLRCQDPFYEMVRRDSVKYCLDFATPWRASGDWVHYYNPTGIAYAGGLLSRAKVPQRAAYWGKYGWPQMGFISWKSCFFSACSVSVATNGDTGTLAMANNSVLLMPIFPLGKPTGLRRVSVTLTGDNCADVYMRAYAGNFLLNTNLIQWHKTTSLFVADNPLVQVKLVGTSTGNINDIKIDWSNE